MVDPMLVVGVLIACFVAYHIGGATTGPAFGPTVGANVLSKPMAGGSWRRVVDPLGEELAQEVKDRVGTELDERLDEEVEKRIVETVQERRAVPPRAVSDSGEES